MAEQSDITFDMDANMEALMAAAEMMRLLSNPHRLVVLCHMGDGEQTVGALADMVGMSPSALSQHLSKLKAAGLVATRRDHNRIFYRLASNETEAIIGLLKTLYCDQKPG